MNLRYPYFELLKKSDIWIYNWFIRETISEFTQIGDSSSMYRDLLCFMFHMIVSLNLLEPLKRIENSIHICKVCKNIILKLSPVLNYEMANLRNHTAFCFTFYIPKLIMIYVLNDCFIEYSYTSQVDEKHTTLSYVYPLFLE